MHTLDYSGIYEPANSPRIGAKGPFSPLVIKRLEYQNSLMPVNQRVLKTSKQCRILSLSKQCSKSKEEEKRSYPWNSTEYLTVSPWTITGLQAKKCFMLVERIEIFWGAGNKASSPKIPSKRIKKKERKTIHECSRKKLRGIAQTCVFIRNARSSFHYCHFSVWKYFTEKKTTKEHMTEQLGWHCLQKGNACLFLCFRGFPCISKTVRKGQAFIKPSNSL